MINIALADDHAILRKGVASIISNFDGMSVVMEAGNGKELVDQLGTAKKLPHICILDINMPVMDGYETAKAIKMGWPAIKILALSMYDTEVNIIKMLSNGANGYILKDSGPEELEVAINEVVKYGYYHTDIVNSRLLKKVAHPSDADKYDLTEKELNFIKLACSEMTYKEIAEQLNLSPRTIDGYREQIFMKLGIKSRTGLVVFAIRAGLVLV